MSKQWLWKTRKIHHSIWVELTWCRLKLLQKFKLKLIGPNMQTIMKAWYCFLFKTAKLDTSHNTTHKGCLLLSIPQVVFFVDLRPFFVLFYVLLMTSFHSAVKFLLISLIILAIGGGGCKCNGLLVLFQDNCSDDFTL